MITSVPLKKQICLTSSNMYIEYLQKSIQE